MSLMAFCGGCKNLLFPQEKERQLWLVCRLCGREAISPRLRVYRNVIKHELGEMTQVVNDMASDPTLPRTKTVKCPTCEYNEAVFFQVAERGGEDGTALFFLCCNPECGHRWREGAIY